MILKVYISIIWGGHFLECIVKVKKKIFFRSDLNFQLHVGSCDSSP